MSYRDGHIYKCDKCSRVTLGSTISTRGNSIGCNCPPFKNSQYYEVIA